MRTAYRNADIEFLNQHVSSGACAVSVLVKEGEMIVANAGDCKAVLCRDGKAESLSICHRASNQTERQRVEDLGGIVECCHGIWRVQGTLAVTKSLGDASLKRWISAEPASKRMVITQEYEFLILASDGLWDKMSDQEAVDCVRKVLNEAEDNMDVDVMTPTSNIQSSENHVSSILLPIQHEDHSLQASGVKQKACNELIRIACQRGNRDDITVMIVPVDVFALS
ncbi:hypothetical protein KP509_05G022700 [Ceratopteris richardii]|nr:hypothetical protein KP509_05G022700 [Ceratopteris richardii]